MKDYKWQSNLTLNTLRIISTQTTGVVIAIKKNYLLSKSREANENIP